MKPDDFAGFAFWHPMDQYTRTVYPTGRTDHRLAPIHHCVFIFALTRVHVLETRVNAPVHACVYVPRVYTYR